MSQYEDYERESNSIREENHAILGDFETWTLRKGLSEATAKKHRENIDFYINEFLLYESPKHASEGVDEVGMFLGYWFIRKAMWASEASIKSNATSLKKFYDFMMERGDVDPEAVKDMKERIKEDLPEWVATIRRYDDPSVDPQDVWRW
jgi:site-specific recombinase XerD